MLSFHNASTVYTFIQIGDPYNMRKLNINVKCASLLLIVP